MISIKDVLKKEQKGMIGLSALSAHLKKQDYDKFMQIIDNHIDNWMRISYGAGYNSSVKQSRQMIKFDDWKEFVIKSIKEAES